MTRGYIPFIAWCALVVILFAYAFAVGWSPFAEGRRGSGFVYVRTGGGPQHK